MYNFAEIKIEIIALAPGPARAGLRVQEERPLPRDRRQPSPVPEVPLRSLHPGQNFEAFDGQRSDYNLAPRCEIRPPGVNFCPVGVQLYHRGEDLKREECVHPQG
jgi:hypothetical protein